jgi:hypothetical protein
LPRNTGGLIQAVHASVIVVSFSNGRTENKIKKEREFHPIKVEGSNVTAVQNQSYG